MVGIFNKLICFVISCMLFTQLSHAQTDRYVDKTVLHNGSVIWGITELEAGQVKILLSAKDSVTVPDHMVKSIKTGKFNPALYSQRIEGFYYEFAAGVLIGKSHHSSENEGTFTTSFAGGYKFNRLLGVGLGVGLNYYTDQRHVPLFLDIQGDWLEGRVTPFHQLNIGWSLAADRDDIIQVAETKGGGYLRPSLGVRWHFPNHSWQLKVSYVRQEATRHFEPIDFRNGSSLETVEDRTMQRVAVAVGITF